MDLSGTYFYPHITFVLARMLTLFSPLPINADYTVLKPSSMKSALIRIDITSIVSFYENANIWIAVTILNCGMCNMSCFIIGRNLYRLIDFNWSLFVLL